MGDTKFFKYDKMLSRHYPTPYGDSNPTGYVIDGEVVKVDVTCNRDIGSEYPVESSLVDMLTILYADNWWVVQNNYRNYDGASPLLFLRLSDKTCISRTPIIHYFVVV